ncbi:MAG: rRNA maturation RNase YbeY [Planctomycetota bacterium]|nr:rRNA maturation RNase YbeY [Planctomycetota bacterium]MDA1248907.1 rRNA maturation RNase YbeY [Planctomycetota bacterium]
MYQVDVADHQDCLSVETEAVREIVRQTLAAEEIVAATISVAIVGNSTMHELNRQYLSHDYETDVLSFLLESTGGDEEASGIPRGTGKTIDGEIIVSSEYAAMMASEFGWQPLDELTLYIVHGLLHLCGYDDLTDAELPVMRQREREVLALLGLEQPLPTRPVAPPAGSDT